jgi:hypothetical protein
MEKETFIIIFCVENSYIRRYYPEAVFTKVQDHQSQTLAKMIFSFWISAHLDQQIYSFIGCAILAKL